MPMGYGDKLLAIGEAWRQYQADPLHRLVAIGDGKSVDPTHGELTWGLEFLATQEQVAQGREVSWVIAYGAHHGYHDHEAMRAAVRRNWWLHYFGFLKAKDDVGKLGHYIFNLDYRATPAPICLTETDRQFVARLRREPFVVIEPYIKREAPRVKHWPVARYAELSRRLSRHIRVYQLSAPGAPQLAGIERIETNSFRDAMIYIAAARLFVGPEGGLHHASAAMGTRAVVIFGGFIPAEVTGYDFHVNLTGGSTRACGTHPGRCTHCETAMNNISVDEVEQHAYRLLGLVPDIAPAAELGSQTRPGQAVISPMDRPSPYRSTARAC